MGSNGCRGSQNVVFSKFFMLTLSVVAFWCLSRMSFAASEMLP